MPSVGTVDGPRAPSSRTCLFVGAVAVAAGAFTYRRSLRNVNTLRARAVAQTSATSAPRARLELDPKMFGGGDGVEVPAKGKPTGALIFMHGLGDSGQGWAPAFPLRGLDHVRTILPSAPSQPVTVNMGYRSPSWFDLKGLDEHSPDDEMGILESVARVNRIIDSQVMEGIPPERIVVAGFSQGAAVALTTVLRSARRLAGAVALSGWLPLRTQYPTKMTGAARDTEIFMGHGTADQVVSFSFGEKSLQTIQGLDRKITFKAYPGLTHSASAEELEDMREFVSRMIPRQ